MLAELISRRRLRARAVIGFWPAARVGSDDIVVYADEERSEPLATLHHLRQQIEMVGDRPNLSLADYIAPADSGCADYVGGFAVTAGLGAEELAARYEADGDDYSAIMVKALADRLAESLAETMHRRVRKEFWGYAPDEALTNEELIRERYRGIRPAPGYPACPDHTEKATLFRLLDATEQIGMELTEHYAMSPAASVSGFYRSEEHTSELQSRGHLVCRLLLEKKNDTGQTENILQEQITLLKKNEVLSLIRWFYLDAILEFYLIKDY